MSNYTKATNFATKDALTSGDPNKVVKGTEIDNEFNAIAGAIASKADTASPALTGTPTAPTAVTGTNTTQIATTAFVTSAITGLGNMSTQNKTAVDITGGTIVGITDLAVADGGTGASTLTANAVLIGNGTSPITSISPSTDDNVLISNGTSWTSASIGSIAGFDKSLATSGYQKLPSGLIIQWGQYNSTIVDTSSPVTITLPIAFPTSFASVTSNLSYNTPITGSSAQATYNYITSLSTFNVFVGDTGTNGNVGFTWMAIGY